MDLTRKQFWEESYRDRQPGILPDKHQVFDLELMEIFERFLPRKKGLNLIELGCGGSKWLPYFSRKFGYSIFGIDYSETGVKKAKENLELAKCNGKIWCLDFIHELPISLSKSFDVVVSLGVIEHFESPEKILDIFIGLLRDGGIIVTVCPNMLGLSGYMQKTFSRETYKLHKLFNLTTLKSWHVKANLEIIYSSYFYFVDFGKIFPVWDKLPAGLRFAYSKINALTNIVYILLYRVIKNTHNLLPFLCSMMVVIGRKKQ